MAETEATILIPDISGFTEFMTTTELSHSSHAINMLIDAMMEAIGEDYEVSEIEGDALLLIRKGDAPNEKELVDRCLSIYNAFHLQRKWMQQYTICPCGACQALASLTVKFVVHHGPLAEIKVGRFVKHSGTDMIVAHRLLKNSINSHEYLLITERLLDKITAGEKAEREWVLSSEEYPSIGEVRYQFSLLEDARKNVPDPPPPPTAYRTDNSRYGEIKIRAPFRDVYMTVMDIPGRVKWLQGLQKVEQSRPEVFIGSKHYCSFGDVEAILSPLRMALLPDSIQYAESCLLPEKNLSLVHEYRFSDDGIQGCQFYFRFMNASDKALPAEVHDWYAGRMLQFVENLKDFCETNSAEPASPF